MKMDREDLSLRRRVTITSMVEDIVVLSDLLLSRKGMMIIFEYSLHIFPLFNVFIDRGLNVSCKNICEQGSSNVCE